MPRPLDRGAKAHPATDVRRFTDAERWVHRTTSALMMTCVITALFLYVPALAEMVGRRRLLVVAHEWCGIFLPVPLAVGLFFRAVRADLGRLNRFTGADRRWLRGVLRRGDRRTLPAGKFNAGQKLYAAFTGGAILVMLGTGIVLWFPDIAPLTARTGSTFVHDWLALLIGVLVLGHIWMALKDPEARHGMRTGFVSRAWARREHPQWDPRTEPDSRSASSRRVN
jgi:formate dehydrogenase subunit gamma